MANKTSKTMKLAVIVLIDNPTSSCVGSYQSSWISAYPVILTHESPRGFEYLSSYGEQASLSKVMFRDLLNSDRTARDGSGLLGSVISTEISHAKAYEIEPVLKALKTIDGKMEKLSAKYGSPANFAQAVLRFADAIGAESIVTRNSTKRRQNTGNDYTVTGLQTGAWDVEHQIRDWFEQVAPVAVSTDGREGN